MQFHVPVAPVVTAGQLLPGASPLERALEPNCQLLYQTLVASQFPTHRPRSPSTASSLHGTSAGVEPRVLLAGVTSPLRSPGTCGGNSLMGTGRCYHVKPRCRIHRSDRLALALHAANDYELQRLPQANRVLPMAFRISASGTGSNRHGCHSGSERLGMRDSS